MGVTPLNTSDCTSGAGDLHGLVALFVGCFLSVADCRLLAVGCWLLAVGCCTRSAARVHQWAQVPPGLATYWLPMACPTAVTWDVLRNPGSR